VASGGIDMDFSMKFYPIGVGYHIGRSEVVLRWTENFNLDSSKIIGYRVYRGTSPEDMTLYRSLGNVDSFHDIYIDNSETYYYQITTLSVFGESPPCEIMEVKDDVDFQPSFPKQNDADGNGECKGGDCQLKRDRGVGETFYHDGKNARSRLTTLVGTGILSLHPRLRSASPGHGVTVYWLKYRDICPARRRPTQTHFIAGPLAFRHSSQASFDVIEQFVHSHGLFNRPGFNRYLTFTSAFLIDL